MSLTSRSTVLSDVARHVIACHVTLTRSFHELSFDGNMCTALLSGASLAACASCGCAAGTAVVQVLGAELTADSWAELRGDVQQIMDRGIGADKEIR